MMRGRFERQPREARARRGDGLHQLGRLQGVAAPVALEGVADGSEAARYARALALADLDGGETQRLARERQAAPGLLAVIAPAGAGKMPTGRT